MEEKMLADMKEYTIRHMIEFTVWLSNNYGNVLDDSYILYNNMESLIEEYFKSIEE